MLPTRLQMPKVTRPDQVPDISQGKQMLEDFIEKADEVRLRKTKPGQYQVFTKYERNKGLELDEKQVEILRNLMTKEDKPLIFQKRVDGRHTELTTVRGNPCSSLTKSPCYQQFDVVGDLGDRPRSILEAARWMIAGRSATAAMVGMPPKAQAVFLEANSPALADHDASTGVADLEDGWIKSALSGAAEVVIEPAFKRVATTVWDGISTIEERVAPHRDENLQHHLYVRGPGGGKILVGALTNDECLSVRKSLGRTQLPWRWQRVHDQGQGHTTNWQGPNQVNDDQAPDLSEISSKTIAQILRGAHEVRILPRAGVDEPHFLGRRQRVEALDAAGEIIGWDVPYNVERWHTELAKVSLPVSELVGSKETGKWHYSLRGRSMSEDEYREHREGASRPALAAE